MFVSIFLQARDLWRSALFFQCPPDSASLKSDELGERPQQQQQQQKHHHILQQEQQQPKQPQQLPNQSQSQDRPNQEQTSPNEPNSFSQQSSGDTATLIKRQLSRKDTFKRQVRP